MKKTQRITVVFAIFMAFYIFVFMQSLNAQKNAFKQNKAEVLVLAGYNATSQVIVWREYGRYYVDGVRYTDPSITSGIDYLIKTNENYQKIQILMLSSALLTFLLYWLLYSHIKELEEHSEALKAKSVKTQEELDAVNKSYAENTILFFEQEAINRKRSEVTIYDYALDTAHPLDSSDLSDSEEDSFGEVISEEIQEENSSSETDN